jgi:hypothetical protein
MGECLGKSRIEKCKICSSDIYISYDTRENEIVTCPGCGIEWIVKFFQGNIFLEEFVFEGEDFGE